MVKVQSKSKGLAKRIVPCLDVKNGETVKGTNFVNLRSAGDPVELGKAYSDAGADELVFLDITASFEERKTFTDMVTRVAAEINIPFTVGGGINELKDVERLLNAGADKVSINSAAIRHPELINEIANHYGSQVCVCAIDARLDPDGWHCYVKGGRERVELGLFDWAKEVADRGAGEILFTSMDHDGVKQGFANEALARLAEEVSIPIIASGGAGKHNGVNGDLQVIVRVEKSEQFERQDKDLYYNLVLDFSTAVLGGEIEIPTLEGKTTIKIEPGTQPGKQLRLRGKGMPAIKGYGYGRGDIIVNITVYIPKTLNKEEKELVKKFKECENFQADKATKKSLFDSIKNLFNK